MLELSKYPSLDMDNIYETIQPFEKKSKLYLQRNWKTSKLKMKCLSLRRIFPPWHGWGLEEPTVLHLDTICSRGRAPPPLLGSEGILFENRVAVVGKLSASAKNAFNSFVGRVFANSRQKTLFFRVLPKLQQKGSFYLVLPSFYLVLPSFT